MGVGGKTPRRRWWEVGWRGLCLGYGSLLMKVRQNYGGLLEWVCIGWVGGRHLRGKGQLWGGIGIEECDEYCGDLRVQW